MLASWSQGPVLRRTRLFFRSRGRNHRLYSLHLPGEGWPGWVGLSDLENIVMVDPLKVVAYPSTNRAWRSFTSLMWWTPLPLLKTNGNTISIHVTSLVVRTFFVIAVVCGILKWALKCCCKIIKNICYFCYVLFFFLQLTYEWWIRIVITHVVL